MPRIAPNTLLKLMSQRSEDKVRDLRKYDEPGGYDATKSFRRAIQLGLPEAGLAGVALRIEKIPVPSEKSRAKGFFPVLKHKLESIGTKFIEPPRALWRSPKRMFSVDFHPEAAIIEGNHRALVFVYCNQKTKPTPTSAGALIVLARRALKEVSEEADEIVVLDIARGTAYRAVNNTSAEVLDKEIADLDAWFASRAR
ncbi:MAG: hypothetical protein HY054_04270 [Proteobacteria bacterium]|nr:hypothetical protein [Pseudomonadota bacterium]